MERFFGLITGAVPLPMPQNNPIDTYKALIYHRYYEVITQTMPRFCAHIDADTLREAIEKLIAQGVKSPYIWQLPEAFARYVIDETSWLQTRPFLADMLWYETTQIALWMGIDAKPPIEEFAWEKRYTLSSSARIALLKHAVFEVEREEETGAFALLLYYDFAEHEVQFMQITPFAYALLEELEGTLESALERVCALYDVELEEARPVITPLLAQWAHQGVLTPTQS